LFGHAHNIQGSSLRSQKKRKQTNNKRVLTWGQEGGVPESKKNGERQHIIRPRGGGVGGGGV